jgi:two-component system sensor histidine kinase RegB
MAIPELSPGRLIQASRMQQLAWFRALSLALQTLSVVAAVSLVGVVWSSAIALVLLGNLVLLCLITWRARCHVPGKNRELFAHLLADQIGLALLVALTGGAANPFIMLLLLPVALAAVLLPGRYVLLLLLMAAGTYFLLLARPAAHFHHYEYADHLRGMWVAFVLAATMMAGFVYWTARSLRYRETALRQLQASRLRDEKLLALGTQAANAAHDMGTPLSTARLLIDELALTEDRQARDAIQSSLVAEIDRCSSLLRGLAQTAHRRRGEKLRVEDAESWLRQQTEHWRGLNPHLTVDLSVEADLPVLHLDESLGDILGNLLSNAAAQSPNDLRVALALEQDHLMMVVADRGPGVEAVRTFQAEDMEASGQGLGMGVMLSASLAERAGGKLVYRPREGGGTEACIVLPLAEVT